MFAEPHFTVNPELYGEFMSLVMEVFDVNVHRPSWEGDTPETPGETRYAPECTGLEGSPTRQRPRRHDITSSINMVR